MSGIRSGGAFLRVPFKWACLGLLSFWIVSEAGGDRCDAAVANPFDDTIRILERWTVTHWGRDCFVWIVHYPEELVDPWVDAEALRVGMSESERRAYRDTFVSELRMGKAEPFLLTVYSFGPRPVSLAPVSDNVLLVTSSGERLRPVRYDSQLDQAVNGVVQGLVFFPKQVDADFAVAVRGMGVHDERLFSFAPTRGSETWNAESPTQEDPGVVVVELPKKSPKKRGLSRSVPQRPTPVAPPVVTPPPPPVAPRPIPPLLSEDSGDMAAFVESVRERGASSPDVREETPPKNVDNAYVSREQVLRRFLALWSDNRPDEMYAMLAASSRRALSQENFAKEISKAADFRAGLKSGYRIDWLGEERAKVIADRRFLMFRSLVVRTLGIVREESSWKVVW